MPPLNSDSVKSLARASGFDLVGITSAGPPRTWNQYQSWLQAGYAGEMGYLSRRLDAYRHPDRILPGVRSLILLGLNYRTADPPPPQSGAGRVSRYAWGTTDYHTLIRQKLRHLTQQLKALDPAAKMRGVVDTAPLLERDFAQQAGLGWFGKNTLLINRQQGSWLFLAAVLTTVDLEPDAPHHTSHCGTCTRCLDVCPTSAFPEPYVLDARRCLSYLTIELRTPIPNDLRTPVGEWLFGCDLCQEVCPWNRKAPRSHTEEFEPQVDLPLVQLGPLFECDAAAFESKFGQTPLARPGRSGLLRNAAIVLGNQRHRPGVPPLLLGLADADPLVRGASAWALGEIGGTEAIAGLRSRHAVEQEALVRQEIESALSRVT